MDVSNKMPPSPFGKAVASKQTELDLIKGELKVVVRPNGKLNARIHLGKGQYKFVSLGTRSWNEAPELARAAYYKIKTKVELGVAVKRLTFNNAWADFEKHLNNELVLGHRTKSTFEAACYSGRYLVEFLGKDSIDQIDANRVSEFILWRRKQAGEANRTISAKTLNIHLVHLKQCLAWVHDKKKVIVANLDFKRVKEADGRRPAFSLEDYTKLYRFMRKWAPAKRESDAKAYNRQMLRHLVLIGANTGMRPGELLNLRWREVSPFKDEQGRDNYRFNVTTGKTVKYTGARDVVGRVRVKGYLDRWRKLSTRIAPDDYVFHGEDGGILQGVDISFRRLLAAADMRVDKDSIKHTMYSLRHTYATFYLKHRRNPDVFLLAMNMGTSVQMIKQFYGQIKVMDKATHLGG